MFKWEIHCCDKSNQVTDGYFPQPINEITVHVYADDESVALEVASELVTRECYQAVECVEELHPEVMPLGAEKA